jgi:ribosomal protein L29
MADRKQNRSQDMRKLNVPELNTQLTGLKEELQKLRVAKVSQANAKKLQKIRVTLTNRSTTKTKLICKHALVMIDMSIFIVLANHSNDPL